MNSQYNEPIYGKIERVSSRRCLNYGMEINGQICKNEFQPLSRFNRMR